MSAPHGDMPPTDKPLTDVEVAYLALELIVSLWAHAPTHDEADLALACRALAQPVDDIDRDLLEGSGVREDDFRQAKALAGKALREHLNSHRLQRSCRPTVLQ